MTSESLLVPPPRPAGDLRVQRLASLRGMPDNLPASVAVAQPPTQPQTGRSRAVQQNRGIDEPGRIALPRRV